MATTSDITVQHYKPVVVKVADLQVSANNPRGLPAEKAISNMAKSITEMGLRVPPIVDAHGPLPWQVLDGNCRLAALKSLGVDNMEIQVLVPIKDDDPATVRSAIHQVGRGWKPWSKANDCREALERGYRKTQVCEMFAVGPRRLDNYLETLALLKKYNQPNSAFSLWLSLVQRRIPPSVALRMIATGQLQRTSQVKWLPLILQEFRRPWEMGKSIEELATMAAEKIARRQGRTCRTNQKDQTE